ncbi:MAG: thiosulfate oxidation carrier complex protein SoxZ [Thioalkalispiraceae bacterium]|jgi:sulfur-oxidizing protein SoxZ
MAKSIRVRAKAKGDTTTVKALITHPMETGLRKNKKTGEKIPAHFIQEVTCKLNGANVMTAHWGPAVSKNPYVSIKVSGAKAGDSVELAWVDNKGGKDSTTTQVK